MARVILTYEFIREAAQNPKTRRALHDKAVQVQRRAEGIARGDNVTLNSKVVDGTRPKGRPYSRVESPNVAQEWGSSKVDRRRILGRAAEEGR